MKIFGKKELKQEKKPEQKPKKDPDKSNLLKPIIIGITSLVIIVLIGLLTKNTLIVIIVAIVVQIGFIIYLARILEKEYEIKLRHLKEKEEAEAKAKSMKQQLEKAEAQVKFKPVQRAAYIPKITNFEDLKKYIDRTLKLRFKKEEIKSALLSTGWSEEQIEKGFSEVQKPKVEKIV